MRTVLFTGKGGVGKTTTAAACAVSAARAGVRTLVMSTGAADSLGDALDVALHHGLRGRDAPRPTVLLEPNLHTLQAGARHREHRSWRLVRDYLLEVLASLGVDAVVAEELTSLPGAEQVAALLELQTHAMSGEWDLVVVDCAPTAETLRLLALPEALAWHLERLLPAQQGLLRTLRPAVAVAGGMPLPSPEVAGAVAGWYHQMREVHALITGESASVRLVLTPERLGVAEARRAWTSLSLHGFVVDGVVVNRVIPQPEPTSADPWRTAWNDAQRAGLAEVRESFAGMPVVQAPYLAREPVGADALADLAAQMTGDPLALMDRVRHPAVTVERSGAAYLLVLPLPLVSARDVDLKRRGDELLIVVGDHRRVLRLPAVLQRCTVRSARVKDGTLKVSFEPDLDLWPDKGGRVQERTASVSLSEDGVSGVRGHRQQAARRG